MNIVGLGAPLVSWPRKQDEDVPTGPRVLGGLVPVRPSLRGPWRLAPGESGDPTIHAPQLQ